MTAVRVLLVSIPEAAEALGLGLTKTKALAYSGELRTVRVDRRRLVPVDALEEYVARLSAKEAA